MSILFTALKSKVSGKYIASLFFHAVAIFFSIYCQHLFGSWQIGIATLPEPFNSLGGTLPGTVFILFASNNTFITTMALTIILVVVVPEISTSKPINYFKFYWFLVCVAVICFNLAYWGYYPQHDQMMQLILGITTGAAWCLGILFYSAHRKLVANKG